MTYGTIVVTENLTNIASPSLRMAHRSPFAAVVAEGGGQVVTSSFKVSASSSLTFDSVVGTGGAGTVTFTNSTCTSTSTTVTAEGGGGPQLVPRATPTQGERRARPQAEVAPVEARRVRAARSIAKAVTADQELLALPTMNTVTAAGGSGNGTAGGARGGGTNQVFSATSNTGGGGGSGGTTTGGNGGSGIIIITYE